MESTVTSYLQQHWDAVLGSLPYFLVLSLIGVPLALRRAALFGMTLAQAAQVAFIFGAGWHFAGHDDAFQFINRSGAHNLGGDLLHLDLYVFPLTFLMLAPFLFIARKPLRSVDSGLLLAFIVFLNCIPLANKIVGGGERTLLSVYFSEILYTPSALFVHYLPYITIAGTLILLFQRPFTLAAYDPMQARLGGLRPSTANILFYLLAGCAIAASVRVVGIYLTMTALVAPPMAALLYARSMVAAFIFSGAFALLSTITGFGIAFLFSDYPSEPIMILVFAALTAAAYGIKKSALKA